MKKIRKELKLYQFRLETMLSLFDMYYESKKIGEDIGFIYNIESSISGMQNVLGLSQIDLFNLKYKGKLISILHSLNKELSKELTFSEIDIERLNIIKHNFAHDLFTKIKDEEITDIILTKFKLYQLISNPIN